MAGNQPWPYGQASGGGGGGASIWGNSDPEVQQTNIPSGRQGGGGDYVPHLQQSQAGGPNGSAYSPTTGDEKVANEGWVQQGAGMIGAAVPGLPGMGGLHNQYEGSYLSPDPRMQQMTTHWALTGEGPSAAQALHEQNASQAQRRARGMAASVPGMTAGGQQRLAMDASAQLQSDANAQAAALRAQEQQQAAKNYQDMYRTMAQAYADKERANAQVASENAGVNRGIVGGIISGTTGALGF